MAQPPQQLQLQLQQNPQQQQPGAASGAAATSIEPVHVPARFGPGSASRIGTLFWPQMTAAAKPAPAAARKRSRADAALTDEDRKLEEDLGLQRVAKPKPAPSLAAASPKQQELEASSGSVGFTDSLPDTRASASRPVGCGGRRPRTPVPRSCALAASRSLRSPPRRPSSRRQRKVCYAVS